MEVVTPLADQNGLGIVFEDRLGDDYVLPYDVSTLCSVGTCATDGGPADPRNTFPMFLARTDGLPSPTAPSYEFSSAGDATVESFWAPSWDLAGLTLNFSQGRSLTVKGSLTADDVTLTAADPSQGWGGLRFESGSSGDLSSSFIEDVSASNSVYVYNADVTFVDSQIRDGSGRGLYVSGSQADVTFKEGTNNNVRARIANHSSGAAFVRSSAEVHFEEALLENNGSRGVTAYVYGDVTLFETEVIESTGYGISADLAGNVDYGDPTLSRRNENNEIDDHDHGTFFGMDGGTHFAGTLCDDAYSDNNFIRQGSELHADLTASDVLAEYNYWGSSSGPQSGYIQTADGAAFDGNPYLASAGANCNAVARPTLGVASAHTAQSEGVSPENDSGNEVSGPPEGMDSERWYALHEAHNGDRDTAFGLLVSAIQTADSDADRRRAYAVLAQLASRGATPPSVGAFLTARTGTAPGMAAHRPWALGALSALRFAEGNTAEAVAHAATLTAEYAGSEHALRGWVARHAYALEAGDEAAAAGALGALETGWPERSETASAQEEHALYYAGEAGARTGRGELVAARGTTNAPASRAAAAESTLGAAYPNPSRATVTLPLVLDDAAAIRAVVYDVLGRSVAVLADGAMEAGIHTLVFDGAALPAGLYVVRAEVQADNGAMRRMHQRVTITR
jgi:hypothetical protein